jgi:hypothetical protein
MIDGECAWEVEVVKLELVSMLSHKLGKKITIKDIDTVMIVYNAADLYY